MDYHYDTVCFPSEWFENVTKKEETKEMDCQASVDLIGWNWSQNFTCNLLVSICIPQHGPGENSERMMKKHANCWELTAENMTSGMKNL